jgi:ribosomal-protein-alanine N-acetyltransferase
MQVSQVIEEHSTGPFRLVPIRADGSLAGDAPPLSSDVREFCEAMAALYRKVGWQPPWVGYVSIFQGQAVGGGAFVGPPIDSRVEIAYFTAPEHERRGYATLTAKGLLEIARGAAPSVLPFAKTEPRLNSSTAILTSLGFAHAGSTTDEEIGEAWLWVIKP